MRLLSDANANQNLSDDDLQRREESEGREYHRLWDRERRVMQTTYREPSGSRLLVHAWERWSLTRVAAKVRGLAITK